MVGGVLLGLIEAIGAGYLGELTGGVFGSQYVEIFAFLVLILVLTLRPSGLMGERGRADAPFPSPPEPCSGATAPGWRRGLPCGHEHAADQDRNKPS